MIYCNLSNHRSVTLSAPKLFAGSVTNASGSFAYAMEHPIQNIPVTTAGSLGNDPAHANQGIWFGSNDLAGKDSVLVPGLVSCAVLRYQLCADRSRPCRRWIYRQRDNDSNHQHDLFQRSAVYRLCDTDIDGRDNRLLCGFPWRTGKEMGYKTHLLYRWLCIPFNGDGHSGYDRKHFLSIDCSGKCFFP